MRNSSPDLEIGDRCRSCSLREQCLPDGLSKDFNELAKFEETIIQTRLLRQGAVIVRSGQPFENLYAVKSGSVKTSYLGVEGEDICTGFCFPSDVFGLKGMASQTHQITATALEQSEICVISFPKLRALMHELPQLLNAFYHLLSRHIVQQEEKIVLMSHGEALERVANFLLYVSEANSLLQENADHLTLTMSRQDIGSYLGLAKATVSRCMSALEERKAIVASNREVDIVDRPMLSAIAKNNGESVAN